jgi:transcriptional regulator with XRE-family HTH domain
MNNKSLGSFISELRKEKRLTQRELAELLNVSDKTVSHWECDENSPDISTLPLLAGVPLADSCPFIIWQLQESL